MCWWKFHTQVIFVTETQEAAAIERLAEDLRVHGGDPEAIRAVSIDMSPAYIRGVAEHLPNSVVTFDKYHVIAHASHALDLTRRAEQKRDPDLKGLRWALLKIAAASATLAAQTSMRCLRT